MIEKRSNMLKLICKMFSKNLYYNTQNIVSKYIPLKTGSRSKLVEKFQNKWPNFFLHRKIYYSKHMLLIFTNHGNHNF